MKNARGEGLAYTFVSGSSRRIVLAVLSVWLFLGVETAFYLYGRYGLFCVAASFLVFFYYEILAYRKFGGLTGDLAGWFVGVYELVFAWLTGIMGYLWNL